MDLVGQVLTVNGDAVGVITKQDGNSVTFESMHDWKPGDPMPAPGAWQNIEDTKTGVGMRLAGDATDRTVTVFKDDKPVSTWKQVLAGAVHPTPQGDPLHCGEFTLQVMQDTDGTMFLYLKKPIAFYFEKP